MEDNIDIEMELPEEQQINTGVPLFLKKLWKMVNDEDAEHIICWNETGDGFIILNEFEFCTKLLPHYFKHNKMASFVRQLNFYNFHKVSTVNDEIQFVHNCFVKGVPELLVLIRRKNTAVKLKRMDKNEEFKDFLNEFRKLQGKNALINKQLQSLKQENMTLWSELNSLRLRYEKQSLIINKLINFLLSYIHKHQSYAKQNNMNVPRGTHQSNLNSGPKILELDYRDKKKILGNKIDKTTYTMYQPDTKNPHSTITYSVKIPETKKNVQSIRDILSQNHHSHNDELRFPMKINTGTSNNEITYSIKLPTDESGKMVPTNIRESLFDLLRESERLSMENSSDILTEMNIIDEPNRNMGILNRDPVQEFEPVFSNSTGNTYYTVSYPKELIQNVQTQKETPMSPPILQGPPVEVLDNNSVVEVPGNTNPKFEYSGKDCKADHNFLYPSLSGNRSQKYVSQKLQSNAVELENNIHSRTLSKSAPSDMSLKYSKIPKADLIARDVSKANQYLLDILKENENLSCENPYAGAKQENSTIVPPSTSRKLYTEPFYPIGETPEVELEYIVEAPNSNSSTGIDEMECIEISDRHLVESPETQNKVVQNSVNRNKISKGNNVISNPNLYIGVTQKGPFHSGGSKQQKTGNIKLQTDVGNNVYTKKMFESTCTKDTSNSLNIPKTNLQKIKNSKVKEALLEILKETTSMSGGNPHGSLGIHENTVGPSKPGGQPMRNIKLSSQKNEERIFPIAEMPSEIETEYIVHTPDSNLNPGNDDMEYAVTIDELLETVEPTAQNSATMTPPPLSVSTGSKQLSLLKNPHPSVQKNHKVASTFDYPIGNNSSPSGRRQEIPSNSKLQMNKVVPTAIKNNVYPRKRLKTAGTEVTSKSLKIPKKHFVKIQNFKVDKPCENPDDNLKYFPQMKERQVSPIVEMPSDVETDYIVQTPDSNSDILEKSLDEIPEKILRNPANSDITSPSSVSVRSNEFDTLEIPNSYLEDSQDDLSVLQEIFDNLDSKELTDILGNDCSINVENLSFLEDENPTDLNISCQSDSSAQVKEVSPADSTALVDQYFSPHFFDKNVL